MKISPLTGLLLATLAFSANSNEPNTLNILNLMTEEEAAKTGVAKLSPEALTALNHWLTVYTAKDANILRQTNQSVIEAEAEAITGKIDGKFSGWAGDTFFKLDNGQIWKQRTPGRWRTRKQSPDYIISRNLLGLWELEILDSGKTIGVKRIQ